MIQSFLDLPFEIRELILYHIFFPVTPRISNTDNTPSPFPATEIYPNIQTREDEQTNYRTTIPLSILRTCRQLLREGELLLYRHLKLNLIYRDREEEYKQTGGRRAGGSGRGALRFFENLNPRHRQLIRHVELKCSRESETGKVVPELREWKYLLYFLEIECQSLRVLKLWCPAGLDEEFLEKLRGERRWVWAVLRIEVFGEE
ncbi:hypothetical protein FQN54_007374 [Arachnomyces sp. PD_36]|nr:hypothetical protein FQN54_007374 [Arachnomyces sp. PD_36]